MNKENEDRIDLFVAMAKSIAQSDTEWQAPIARFLNVNRSTVIKWIKGKHPLNDTVLNEMDNHLNQDKTMPEWVCGEGLSDCGDIETYLVHTRWPRFIGRIVDDDVDDYDLTTLSIALNDCDSLVNIVFSDTPPKSQEYLLKMFRSAEDNMNEIYKKAIN